MKQITVKAPGRINIIGEHTDYNYGYVLPTAIDKHLSFTMAANGTDSICQIKSKGYGPAHEFNFQTMEKSNSAWHNYIQGVVSEIQKILHLRESIEHQGIPLKGFNCVISSNLPVGAGVSSSAALECGLSFGLNELFNLGLSELEMVKLSQQADHNYVGIKSGIMDQFASMMSREGTVILLDCRSLEHQYIPLDLKDYTFLLLNSGVSHELTDSEYNTRQQECQEGIQIVQQKFPQVQSLRDVTPNILELSKDRLPSTVYRRSRFVVEENTRVLGAVEALKKGDLKRLGNLLYASHHGLSNDYEVSCRELDFLVDFTKDFEQVLGARIMGGGFGGCSINLIQKDMIKDFTDAVSIAYTETFDRELSWFEAVPSRGVHHA